VTNAGRLEQVLQRYRPEYVYHAAAYKQLPMLEANVVEGLWNNVIGTLRMARCAARLGARRFVLISTDKAVNPSSVLGVTKLLAERLVLELPSLRAAATDFRVVRFGNVLGSEGSVVPRFAQQLAAGGPLTVTHPEMRRYFMTIPEAVQLVLRASALPEVAGQIALLEMGMQVRILELAEQMIRLAGRVPHEEIGITFTGLRPGEKLEEELVAPGETATASSEEKIRIVSRVRNANGDLARQLRHLTTLAARGDETTLLRALAELTPDRHPALDASLEARAGIAGAIAPPRSPRRGRRAPEPALAIIGGTNGHAANGHAANGHAANGHAANGHAARAHAGNGTDTSSERARRLRLHAPHLGH
jgi:FlaA1/EpsC-like NDP-sugar epimerase